MKAHDLISTLSKLPDEAEVSSDGDSLRAEWCGDCGCALSPWGITLEGLATQIEKTLEVERAGGCPDHEPGDEEPCEYCGHDAACIPTEKRCPHNSPLGDCNLCDHESDLAYDAEREARFFGR